MRGNDGVIYALMVLPTLFVIATIGQGISKMQNGDDSGKSGVIFGGVLLVIIIAAYILFIR